MEFKDLGTEMESATAAMSFCTSWVKLAWDEKKSKKKKKERYLHAESDSMCSGQGNANSSTFEPIRYWINACQALLEQDLKW